jgi:hypothetical protein
MSEEKLKELLLKIRKGATASLNWGQLGQVLAALDPGWKLEKTVGLVKLYGYKDKQDDPEWVADTKSEAESLHKVYSDSAVSSLPSKPKHGQLYVMDLSPVQESEHRKEWEFTFKPWMGHNGWKVTTPQGEVFNALPGRYDLSGNAHRGWQPRSKLPLYDVIPWLNKNTDWLEQINRKLNMAPHEPAIPRTRENTGSCPVCFQNIKLNKDKMVLHGYKRPGHGSTEGNCFGYGYHAFELKVDGTKDYLNKILVPELNGYESNLKRLKSGEIEKLNTNRWGSPNWITPDDPQWDRFLRAAVDETERAIKRAQSEVEVYSSLVKHWKERPLPKEGEPLVNWYYKGQKP